MSGLAVMLWLLAVICWMYPKSLGRWLAEVREGMEPKEPKE